MEEASDLTSSVTNLLYSIINACRTAETIDDIVDLLNGKLKQILPHEMAIWGIGNRKSLQVISYINVNFPEGWISQVIDEKKFLHSPIVKTWMNTMQPIVVNDIEEMEILDPKWTEMAKFYSTNNIIAHGVVDIAGTMISYLSLARNPRMWSPLHSYLMEFIVPHLHVALIRILGGCIVKKEVYVALTAREREILQWLYHGKTNPEIGHILEISSFTVKNHIHNLLEKLNATNRSQVVAKAMTLDLIGP